MICSICGKPIKLVPSASERAKKYGGNASDYTNLFTIHSSCQINKRNEEVKELIQRNP
jgi:5-methylcytosine-specific restriction endonuclease McrA